MLGDHPAERQPDDIGAVDPRVVQHGRDVVGHGSHRVRRERLVARPTPRLSTVMTRQGSAPELSREGWSNQKREESPRP